MTINLRPVYRPDSDMMQPHNAFRVYQYISPPLPNIAGRFSGQTNAEAAAGADQGAADGLAAEISDLAAMCEGQNWRTDDPLGLGSLLSNALSPA